MDLVPLKVDLVLRSKILMMQLALGIVAQQDVLV
jgi:hypothetical protein